MLKINQQTKFNENSYGALLKAEPFELNMNIETINRDIARLENQLSKAKNKYNIKNLKYIIKYLNRTKSKIEDGKIEMCWNIDNGRLMSYPTEIKTHAEYKIDASEYVELHNEKMIILDFIDIINIMSFEYIYRDLGYSHHDIEDILESLGITGTVSPKIFIDYFKDEELEPYYLSKQSRIEDSPHINKESHKIKNYYNNKEFNTDSYMEVIMDSAKLTLDIIAAEIVKQLAKKNIDNKLVSIGETTIVLNIKDNTDANVKELLSDISFRVFGRNFEVLPKITIL